MIAAAPLRGSLPSRTPARTATTGKRPYSTLTACPWSRAVSRVAHRARWKARRPSRDRVASTSETHSQPGTDPCEYLTGQPGQRHGRRRRSAAVARTAPFRNAARFRLRSCSLPLTVARAPCIRLVHTAIRSRPRPRRKLTRVSCEVDRAVTPSSLFSFFSPRRAETVIRRCESCALHRGSPLVQRRFTLGQRDAVRHATAAARAHRDADASLPSRCHADAVLAGHRTCGQDLTRRAMASEASRTFAAATSPPSAVACATQCPR